MQPDDLLRAFGEPSEGQVLDAVYAEVRARRERHGVRILGELDTIAQDLTKTLLPPELRAAGLHFAYETEETA